MSVSVRFPKGSGKYKGVDDRKGKKNIYNEFLFTNQFEIDGSKKNPIKVKDNKTLINNINNQIKELW